MILICPETPTGPHTLGQGQPAAMVSLFGRPLLEHFLIHYSDLGIKHFHIIASDRPESIRRFIGNGEKWGVTIQIHAWPSEPTTKEALFKLSPKKDAVPSKAYRVDRLPWMSKDHAIGSESWFHDCLKHPPAPSVLRPDYIELQSKVYAGKQSQIPLKIKIHPPCYIGSQVKIGNGCVIGPNVLIEDEAYIESGCVIRDSFIGSSTYIGPDLTIDRSIVMHDWVLDWSIKSDHRVADPLLLGGKGIGCYSNGVLGRLIAFLTLIVCSPMIPIAWVASLGKVQPWKVSKQGEAPDSWKSLQGEKVIQYSEFPNLNGLAKRYPQIWLIVTGHFRWVGNRPVSPEQAGKLKNEYERMWLHSAYGIFSLADLHGVSDSFSDEEKIHSSFYTATQNNVTDIKIARQCLFK